ncbi:energy transducer TonB, partial [Prevotella sp. OH937_COT-195]
MRNAEKTIRKQIADANGIVYEPKKCNFKGECRGTCPACEQEVKYIEKQLNARRMLGKA